MKHITLTDYQAQRVRDIVSDKQDAIAAAHSNAEKAGASTRAEGLSIALKFWDEIDRAIRDAAEAAPLAQTMTANAHERAEWLRMANDARAKGLRIIADRYEAAASVDHPMLLTRFDDLQAGYRKWLNGGFDISMNEGAQIIEAAAALNALDATREHPRTDLGARMKAENLAKGAK